LSDGLKAGQRVVLGRAVGFAHVDCHQIVGEGGAIEGAGVRRNAVVGAADVDPGVYYWRGAWRGWNG